MLEFIEKRAISDRIQKSPLTLLKRHDRQKATLKFIKKKTKLTKNQPNETNLVKISAFLPVKFCRLFLKSRSKVSAEDIR